MNKQIMLADIRAHIQRPTESLRAFLTDVGARLKTIDYPKNIWLDLIFTSLRPEIQAEKIKRYAQPFRHNFPQISSINTENDLTTIQNTSDN
jgi:hypothetical protein